MTVDNTHTYFENGSAVHNKIAGGGYCIFDLWGLVGRATLVTV
ncbi:MAG: hypothetical protein KA473_14760 [Anaerolineales bacterium]|nr:hypothetical protein [Anaerolineales bacterium]